MKNIFELIAAVGALFLGQVKRKRNAREQVEAAMSEALKRIERRRKEDV